MADQEFLAALRDNAAEVLKDFCPIDAVYRFLEAKEASFDTRLWAKAAELGWLMLAVPETHDGMGGGVAELAILQEALGAHLAPLPFLGTALFSDILAAWPAQPVAAELYPLLMSGELAAGIADLDGAPALRLSGTGPFTLDGSTAVFDGANAGWVAVRVTGDRSEGLALLPTSANGLSIARRPIADRTRSLVTLNAASVAVDADHLFVGDAAVALIARLRRIASILIACDAIGGSEVIFAETVEYLKTRVQFGKPIGSFQALKHRAADLKVRIEMARELVTAAVLHVDDDAGDIWAPMAKFNACDTYLAVASEGVQMHGGIGFTWEHRAHLYLKRATLDRALFGSSAVQQDRLAQTLIAKAA